MTRNAGVTECSSVMPPWGYSIMPSWKQRPVQSNQPKQPHSPPASQIGEGKPILHVVPVEQPVPQILAVQVHPTKATALFAALGSEYLGPWSSPPSGSRTGAYDAPQPQSVIAEVSPIVRNNCRLCSGVNRSDTFCIRSLKRFATGSFEVFSFRHVDRVSKEALFEKRGHTSKEFFLPMI